jgi:hypothetical protein
MFLAKKEFIDLSIENKSKMDMSQTLLAIYEKKPQFKMTTLPDLWEILKNDLSINLGIPQEYLFIDNKTKGDLKNG